MKLLSRVQLLAAPGTVAYQAAPSMGFSRQKYWSGLPFPSPGLRWLSINTVKCEIWWERALIGMCRLLWKHRKGVPRPAWGRGVVKEGFQEEFLSIMLGT